MNGPSSVAQFNVTSNPDFDEGSAGWEPMGGCRLQVFSSTPGPFIQPQSGRNYVVATGRSQVRV
jgi:hypothetical protein